MSARGTCASSIGWLLWAMLGEGLLGGAGAITILVLVVRASPELREHVVGSGSWRCSVALGAAVAFVVLASALSVLPTRDHAIYREIHRARCPKCGQSLLGVPVQART